MAREEFAGAAPRTTLASGIDNTALSFNVASGTGYPTGTHPFVLTIDRGTPTEEKVLAASRSGNTFTITTRGYDGTVAQAHDAGAYVEHTVSAAKLDELDGYVNSAGTGDVTSPSGSKVRTIANNAVTTGKITDGAVTLAKMADAAGDGLVLGRLTSGSGDWEALTLAALAAALTLESTDLSDFNEAVADVLGAFAGFGGAGLTFTYDDAGNTLSLVVNVDGATIEIDTDTLRVKDAGIVEAKIADGAVSRAKVKAEAWTAFTPSLSQNGAVTATVTHAHYEQAGKTVRGTVFFSVTGTGSAGQEIRAALPVAAAAPVGTVVGSCIIDDTGTNAYIGVAILQASGTVRFATHLGGVAGANPNFALASGDFVRYNFEYEAA